jgi:predicted MFS family arabinose efflux permease
VCAVKSRLGRLGVPLRHRDFRLIWGSQLSSQLGDWAARLALGVLMEQRTQSPALVALVTSASVLPWLGPGQLLTTRLERFSRRSVVVGSDVFRAAVFIVLALQPSSGLLLVGAFAAGLFTPPFEANRSAITVSTVPNDIYGDALSVVQITFQAAVLLGYGLGGVFIAAIGARAALVVNACSFLVSAALLIRMKAGREAIGRDEPVRLREGWRVVRDDRYLWVYTTTWSILAACTVIPESLLAAYGPEVLGEGEHVVAALAAAIPVGAVIGIAFFRRTGTHEQTFRRAIQIALVGGLGAAIAFGLGPAMPWAVGCFVLVGIFNASHVPANEVTALRLEERTRAAAFSILAGALVGSQAVGAALGGVAARALGVREAITLAMAIAAVTSWVALTRAPHGRHAMTRVERATPRT